MAYDVITLDMTISAKHTSTTWCHRTMPLRHQSFSESLIVELVRECGRFGNTATFLKIMRCWEIQKTGPADCRVTMGEMGVYAILV